MTGHDQLPARGTLVAIPRDRALSWSRDCLAQGSRVSRQVAERIDREYVNAYAIVPQDRASLDIGDLSISARIGDGARVLEGVLHRLSAVFDGILAVDDDLARRGDPGLDDVSFVDDRVVRWIDLHSAPDDLTRLIRIGASGYPLNALVCGDTDGEAFRPAAGPLSDTDAVLLASQVRVVVHSIYDAESFLLLVIDENANVTTAEVARDQT